MTSMKTIDDLGGLSGRRVMVRVDFNVPMTDGRVTDATRLERAVPTVRRLSEAGAKVILLSHFGRPKGQRREEMSLRPVADAFAAVLGRPVAFAEDAVGGPANLAVQGMAQGDVLLLENTRFHAGEEANDEVFAKALAMNADAYVNDAFSAAHRAHASTEGIARLVPSAAGEAMRRELDYLNAALGAPERPVMAMVGGAKVSTKLDLLQNLVGRVDKLIVGGGMANTFLLAMGEEVGRSLAEPDLVPTAKEVMARAGGAGCELILPRDVVVAEAFEANADSRVRSADAVEPNEMILDLGPDSVDAYAEALEACRTLIWNGPLGAFETPPFHTGTVELARYAAKLTKAGGLTSVAGGGDTVAALGLAGVTDEFTYVSTAGGAFLEWMEGKALPGVEALRG
jgi:phosphoglycerate kinase